MKRTITNLLLSSAVLAGGLYLTNVRSFATPAYAKKEGAKCTACHIGMGKKELNDTGKCYKEHNHSELKTCEAKK